MLSRRCFRIRLLRTWFPTPAHHGDFSLRRKPCKENTNESAASPHTIALRLGAKFCACAARVCVRRRTVCRSQQSSAVAAVSGFADGGARRQFVRLRRCSSRPLWVQCLVFPLAQRPGELRPVVRRTQVGGLCRWADAVLRRRRSGAHRWCGRRCSVVRSAVRTWPGRTPVCHRL